MEGYLSSIARLSDQELRDDLRRFGEDPGPVTATTRLLYKKRLARHVSTSPRGVRGRNSQEPVFLSGSPGFQPLHSPASSQARLVPHVIYIICAFSLTL